MNDLRAAMEKAAINNPEFKAQLVAADKHAAEERSKKNEEKVREAQQKKEAARKAKEKAKKEAADKNRRKKIYAWRTKAHGMNYSMRCGIIFADDLQDAKNIITSKIIGDVITYLEEIDYSDNITEIGLYIE